MDGPVDRGMLEILTEAECWRRIDGEPVGRIAYVAGGTVTVLPVNHVRDGRSVVFRTTHGSRLSPDVLSGPVAFEVDGLDEDTRTGWSVLVHGQAEELDATTATERLRALGRPSRGASHDDDRWVRVRPRHVSGRRIPRRS